MTVSSFTDRRDADDSRPTLRLAEGHYDGDGCRFPDPGHLVPAETSPVRCCALCGGDDHREWAH